MVITGSIAITAELVAMRRNLRAIRGLKLALEVAYRLARVVDRAQARDQLQFRRIEAALFCADDTARRLEKTAKAPNGVPPDADLVTALETGGKAAQSICR